MTLYNPLETDPYVELAHVAVHAAPDYGQATSAGYVPSFRDLIRACGRQATRPVRLDWPGFLWGMVLLVVGGAIVACDDGLRLTGSGAAALFWSGLAVCLAGALLVGLRRLSRHWEQAVALALLGAVLWLPYYLSSPAHLLFAGELYHYQIAQLIAQNGHTRIPAAIHPSPGIFPGLELATLGLVATTGLPLDVAVRIMALLAHVMIPLLMYVIARGLGLGRRGAFVAALVYMANTNYLSFNASVGGETLGIVLVLALWALLVRGPRRAVAARVLPLAVLLIAATAVTHHAGSYILAIGLALVWLMPLKRRRAACDRHYTLGLIAAFGILCPVAWLAFTTVNSPAYASTSITARIQDVVAAISGELLPRHAGALAPGRLIDYIYILLLLVLAVGGLVVVARRGQRRRVHRVLGGQQRRLHQILLPLAILGPLLWLCSAPLVLTSGREVAYSLWPFLFIGLAPYGALAVTFVAERIPVRAAGAGITALILAALLAGGMSTAGSPVGHVASAQPRQTGTPAALDDAVSAALWLNRTAGGHHLLVGDDRSATVFARYGMQRSRPWGVWALLLTLHPEEVTRYLHQTRTTYVVVDQEYAATGTGGRNGLVRRAGNAVGGPLLRVPLVSFAHVAGLSRIYDNGAVQIYELAGAGGAR